MFLPYILVIFSATFWVAQAQILDAVALEAKVPHCAVLCAKEVIRVTGCTIGEAKTCFCPNDVRQNNFAHCVHTTCSLEEEYFTANVLQHEVCNGVLPGSRRKEHHIVILVATPITLLFVALRFISRTVIAGRLWWDDWLILAATIFLIPNVVFPFLPNTLYFGQHDWLVPPQRLIELRKTFYFVQMSYCLSINLAKISILCLYLRIFVEKGFRRLTKVSITLIVLHIVAFLFTLIFQCLPISAIWTLRPATCVNIAVVALIGAVLSIVEDIFIILLPIWELRKLNLSKKKKIALAFTFAFASFASIASVIRLRFIFTANHAVDISWNNVDIQIWSDIEMCTAIICSCILCIRPLLAKFGPCTLFQRAWGLTFKSRPSIANSDVEKQSVRSSGYHDPEAAGTGNAPKVNNSTGANLDDERMEPLPT